MKGGRNSTECILADGESQQNKYKLCHCCGHDRLPDDAKLYYCEKCERVKLVLTGRYKTENKSYINTKYI